jgi:hypothetical protein
VLDWAKFIHEAIGVESPRVFVALFALAGLLLFGSVGWLVDKGYRIKLRESTVATAPQIVPTAPIQQGPEAARIFLPPDISFKKLTGLYQSHTKIQADQLAQPYLGRWLTVNVTISDLQKGTYPPGTYLVLATLGTRASDDVLMLTFEEKSKDQVLMLTRGSSKKISGLLSSITANWVGLTSCEFAE